MIRIAMLATVAIAVVGTHAPVWAQSAVAERKTYDLPGGALEDALNRFSRQAGITLSFDPALVQGRSVPALQGTYTAREGLDALLAGSRLQAVSAEDGTFGLRTVPVTGEATLPEVKVTGSVLRPDELSKPYAGGQVARGSRAGLLGNRDFMETPFNVTSFTSEGIQNQQARSIGDVVKNDPSVRTIWPDGSYISQFTIRGFPVQTQDMSINGLYGIVPPQMTGGLESIERVEILKGPNALLNGMAPTGGVGGNINLVTKRATDAPITQVTTSYYSDAQFGTHLDIGRRFGADKRLGLRFNGAYRDGETGVDDQSQRAGSATLGMDYRGDGFRLSADLGYHSMRTDAPTRVVFTDNPNFRIPHAPDNKLSLGQDWYFAKSSDTYGMLRGEVDLNPNLTAYAAVGARKNDFLGLYNFIYLQNAQGDFRANQYFQPTYSDTRTATAGLTGRFTTGSVGHEINFNASTLHTESGALAPVIATYNANVYDPAVIAKPSLAGYRSSAPKTAESDLTSVAIADTLNFLDGRVQLTLGARQQDVEVQNFSAVTGAPSTPKYDKSRLTPSVALLVRSSESLSLYGNYIEGLSQGPSAPAGTQNAGTIFSPVRAKQYEAGAKYDAGSFAVTASVFQIEQPSGVTDIATNTYSLDGEQRNRGVEFNAFGEIARGRRLLGGVTFMEGVQTSTANGTNDGNKAVGVPTTQFNLGGEWDSFTMPGLTATGRLIYTSSQYYNPSNTQSIPSWTRVDIGARYRMTLSGKALTIRANVENLFDKDYWAAASSSFGLARGAPRTFLLSATMDF